MSKVFNSHRICLECQHGRRYCFEAPIRPPYLRHVKTLYYWQANRAHLTRLALPGQRDCAVTIKNAKIFFFYDLYLAENQTQCPASVLSFEQA